MQLANEPKKPLLLSRRGEEKRFAVEEKNRRVGERKGRRGALLISRLSWKDGPSGKKGPAGSIEKKEIQPA